MNDQSTRSDGRSDADLRPLTLQRGVSPYAEGSCLIQTGQTHVLCTASVEQGVPRWRKGSGMGWLTAEYAMLPRATHTRANRERGQLGGRTQEIQRLIGRSLRASVALERLGEWTIRVDCDVLQADGGTRTASITGAAVAVRDACAWIAAEANLQESPFLGFVAAVSVGMSDGRILLDLDYAEDSSAGVDLNVVALENGDLIEVQGTAERSPFSRGALVKMVDLAGSGIEQLIRGQRDAVA